MLRDSIWWVIFVVWAGLVFLFLWLSDLRKAMQAHGARSWPVTHGEIPDSFVHRQVERRYRQRGRYWTHVYWRPVVKYCYEVDGVPYYSRLISNVDNSVHYTYHTAKRVVDKYKVGQVVDVYYSPSNVQNAVLEPGIPAGFGVVFFSKLLIAASMLALEIVGVAT